MDRKVVSKSAPSLGRRNSTKKDKSTTLKEINGWINKGDSEHLSRKCARGVSNLTENVTEERMLYSRQLELGRERYKFLSNHEYEKQKFVERQNVKDKMMKQFMASARRVIEKTHAERPKKVLTVRIPQMEELSARSSPVADDTVSRAESRASRASSKTVKKKGAVNEAPRAESRASGRNSVLNKYASKQSNKVSSAKGSSNYMGVKSAVRRNEDNYKNNRKTKIVTVPSDKTIIPHKGVYVNTSKTNVHTTQTDEIKTEHRLPSVNVSNSNGRKSASYERSRSTSPTKSVRYIGLPAEPKKSLYSGELVTPQWTQSPRFFGKFGEKFNTSVDDPRYEALANTLMKVEDIKMPQIGVKEIIANNEALRMASKNDSAVHAKQMHAKFIAFLLENEFK